jgi:hypothetical protein
MSLEDAEVVEVDFAHANGEALRLKFLVDSGFTGEESFVLRREESGLIQASIERALAAGALSGVQDRGWVICRVPSPAFEGMMIAIFSDLSPLCLPAFVDGIVGLSFLRHFARVGAERAANRQWRFFLEYTVIKVESLLANDTAPLASAGNANQGRLAGLRLVVSVQHLYAGQNFAMN